jgi:DNA polymerase
MTIDELSREHDKLQTIYGSGDLNSIHFGGRDRRPNIMLVFMNPTKANIAAQKTWRGIRAPWIGTKNIWKLLNGAGLFDDELFKTIQSYRPADWTPEFADKVYDEVAKNNIFITNLGKCTQDDARPLPDKIFRQYLDLLLEEIKIVDPSVIVTFGNQVSSILLDQKIEVSKCRARTFQKTIHGKTYLVYPLYYPVGQGMRNIDKSIEDLRAIGRSPRLTA